MVWVWIRRAVIFLISLGLGMAASINTYEPETPPPLSEVDDFGVP